MGRSRRSKPFHLAGKLFQIRSRLGLTQEQMIKRLDYTKTPLYVSQVSEFESGKREPPLEVILRYARVANLYVEAIIDDSIALPEKLPAHSKETWALRPIHRR